MFIKIIYEIIVEVIIILVAIILALITMWLWNWLMPITFALTKLTFWKALVLIMLSQILVNSFKYKSK